MDICINLRVNILFCDLQVEDDVAVMICIVPLSSANGTHFPAGDLWASGYLLFPRPSCDFIFVNFFVPGLNVTDPDSFI